MNGCTTNGGAGEESNGEGSNPRFHLKVGLLNHQGRYLTAESFGGKLSASATVMRKKQIWFIEQVPNQEDTVYIKSHLGRYLSGDKRGNVSCSTEEEDVGDLEKFCMQVQPDGSGRWAIRNQGTGYYLGGCEDQLLCYEKQPGKTEYWTVHLVLHPQVTIKNNNRRKFAVLNEGECRLEVTALVPWGQQGQVSMEFHNGRYCLKTVDERYLHRNGSLVSQPSTDTYFAIEFKSSGPLSGLALKDCSGKYLTAVGREAVVQTRNSQLGKDELFTLIESHPQVYMTAHNDKMVSYKQGIDLTANKEEEITEQEIFQLEFNKLSEQCRIQTANNTYWSLESASGIQAVGSSQGGKGLFSIEWLEGGMAAIKASNGRYLTAKMNGSLYAVCDQVSDKEKFRLTLVNKARLILRCEHGFVGMKPGSGSRLDCSRAMYDAISLDPIKKQIITEESSTEVATAFYSLKGQNGKYWTVDSDGYISCESVSPVPFILELCAQSKVLLKMTDGRFVCGEQNGQMMAKHCEMDKVTMWEY